MTPLLRFGKVYLVLWSLMGSFVFAQNGKPLKADEQMKFDMAYMNGNREKILGNNEEAIKQFSNCYKINPTNAALNYMMGSTYFELKKYDEATNYAEAAVKLDASNAWYKELLVDCYISQNKNKEAAKMLVDIAHQRKEVEYLIKASYVYVMIKDYKSALKVLTEAEKIVGIDEDIVTRKEQIYLAQNNLNKAIDEVQKLIRANPDNPKYRGMLADLYWANGRAEDAATIYLSIVKEYPTNGFALFALSDYYKLKGDKDEWYSYLKRGMASPDVDVKNKINVLSEFIGGKEFPDQLNRTFELAEIFSSTHPDDATAYLVLGDVYQQQQKLDSARLQYRKALVINPSTFAAWQQLIFCTSQLNNSTYLLADCEEAIQYFPNEPAFYAYGAIAAMQLKQYQKAVELNKGGLEIVTPDQEDLILQLQASLGDAYHYTQNHKACDSIYEVLLAKNPDNVYALNNYAYFLSLRKTQLSKAAEMSKKSLDLEPGNASYLDTYGWILFVQGNYVDAKIYIEKSLQVAPNSAEVLDHLGDVLYKLNDKQQAITNWKKAKELGCENPKLDQKIKEGKWYEQ
jgi:tetratricopeptide (TPR) repeat protein